MHFGNVIYEPGNMKDWQGRVDSEVDFDAFRWHQWIQPIDIETLTPFEGELGIAFIGFCSDEGIRRNKGRVGAAKGPSSIRHELTNLPCRFKQALKLFDAGDLYLVDQDLESAQTALGVCVEKLLAMGYVPIVLGGGHETAFGHYLGIRAYLEQDKTVDKSSKRLGIINFDAHFDMRPYPNGGTSGTMFRQIADICHKENQAFDYCCLGIQSYSNTVALFKAAEDLGATYILAKEIEEMDVWSTIEKIDHFITGKDALYITICTDVFSSAFAPGVSATQPIGIHPEKMLKIFKYLFRTKKVISFDLAEVSPRFDQDSTTSNLAKVLIFAGVNALALQKGLSTELD